MSRLRQAVGESAVESVHVGADGSVSRRYRFGPAFPGFAGHFPGRPILPAIVHVLAGVDTLDAWLGVRQRLVGIDNAKFTLPVGPDQTLVVQCRERDPGPGGRRYEVRLSTDGRPAALFVLETAAVSEGAP